jgi:putative DNA primase/helicase
MVLPANDYNKCPGFDRELKRCAYAYPDLNKVFFGDQRSCEELVSTLATLNEVMLPVNEKENVQIQYVFSEDEILEILDSYKEGTWNTENVNTIITGSRECFQREHSYINNIFRKWKYYEVPAVENGYYEIREPGIFRVIETVNKENRQTQPVTKDVSSSVTKDVCRTPFVLCGISEPLTDDSIYYKIRYATYSGDIKEFWASQSTLLSKKELKTFFLSKGINCPENSLLIETLDYISRCIAEFGPRFKKEFSAKRNGWNADKSIFVLGNRGITAKGTQPVLAVADGKGFPELDAKGNVQGWVDGIKQFSEHDTTKIIRFKMYDAMTAPLKSVLGVESHCTDHYSNTSCGKTLSSWIALSMIGDAEQLTIGAKSTQKGILVHGRDFSDLPILIDESSDAGDNLADLVYTLTSNKGRVKSTVTGARDGGEEYHTTVMFTGERPIRDCLINSGQQYRVIELYGTLPDIPTKEINKVKQVIRDHHGHVIELVIKKIFEVHETGSLHTMYDECLDSLPENTSNIEGRSKNIFACIMVAGKILESVFKDIGIPNEDPVEIVKEYYQQCILNNPVELEYIRALRLILDWVHSEYGRFGEVNLEYDYITTLDRTRRHGYVDEKYIDIIGTEFTKKMKDAGFSPSKIKQEWLDRGITESNDKERRGTHRITREKKTFAGVRIIRLIAEELIGFNYENIGEGNDLQLDEKSD